jgi:hypothetical protein
MGRRSTLSVATAATFSLVILCSCAPTGAGPQAWIDAPLDNTTVPLAPLIITAHASAAGGVARIEFTIDDQSIQSVLTDGNRLEWRAVQWTPPGPGTYVVGARGIGIDGTAGALATSRVTISGKPATPIEIPGPVTATDVTPHVTITPHVTVTPITPGAPAAPSVVAKMNANCREGPGTLWPVYGDLPQGQRADLKGRLADNTWLLVSLMGRSSQCWIAASVVEVQGDLDEVQAASAPPLPVAQEPPPAEEPDDEAPPEVEVIEPEPIEIDNTAPTFVAIDAALMACPSRAVRVAAVVGDASGLSSVIAYWSVIEGGSGSGQLTLTMGSLGYVGTIDPGISEGALQIYFGATDASVSSNYQRSDNILIGIPACIK